MLGLHLQYIHGWHLTRRFYLIAVLSWLTHSSWQFQMASSWRGIFMMILVIFTIFCHLYLLCDICLHWQFCCEILPLCYFTVTLVDFVSSTFSKLFLPLPNCRTFSRLSILFSDIIDCVYFFHLHVSIYMIKSSRSLFLVVEYNVHYQLSIKVKCHCNYYDSVSCSHLYLLLSTYY